jgi:hypothetical protein
MQDQKHKSQIHSQSRTELNKKKKLKDQNLRRKRNRKRNRRQKYRWTKSQRGEGCFWLVAGWCQRFQEKKKNEIAEG